jgi:Uma2 family endonuclease
MTVLKHKLYYDDLAAAPNDGQRYELMEGELYVTPAPSPLHQRTSKRLQRMLEAHFEANGIGEVFNAPVDVVLSRWDVVEPDLVVVADPRQISRRAIEGPPLLMVEILSPSTIDMDREIKAKRYAAFAVPHYWIVDIDARAIDCYRLEGDAYGLLQRVERGTSFEHPDWPGLHLDTVALWDGADQLANGPRPSSYRD